MSKETKKADHLSIDGVSESCVGWRYNFKRGTEICKNKDKCPIYDPDNYEDTIHFDYISDFRKCDKHNSR